MEGTIPVNEGNSSGSKSVLMRITPNMEPRLLTGEFEKLWIHWNFSEQELVKQKNLFISLDRDRDGYLSGILLDDHFAIRHFAEEEVKNFFLSSKLPADILGKIWSLCSGSKTTSKLNEKEFVIGL
jgi:hypothetical protein